jgi:NitT/TauT family transport system substrate-binding protein
MFKKFAVIAVFAMLAAVAFAAPSRAQQTTELKAAIGQKGAWTTAMVDFGMRQGFFQKQGLNVDIYWTQGGAPTLQAVMSGSVDMAIDTGLLGIIGAYEKGGPLRVFSANSTGGPEIFWYAKKSSGFKTMKDVAGKSVAFSEVGSSSNLILLGLLAQNNVHANPIPTGSPPATLTQVMTGQVDVGWGVPPFGLKELSEGQIVILARGNDVPAFRNETVRVNVATADTLKTKRDAFVRFMTAYQQTIDWAYKDPKAYEYYADLTKITPEQAKQVVHQFYPKEEMELTEIKGLDLATKQAADNKFTAEVLPPDDVKGMFDMIKPAP